MDDNKWLVFYLDHEINPWIDFNVQKVGDQVVVYMDNAVFASYCLSSREIVYSDYPDYISCPNQVVWNDDKKGFWCAVVVSKGKDGIKNHIPQQLTEDYWEMYECD